MNDSKVENPRHVVEIGVLGLFNLYDHTVKLNQQERITILHGPNGVGKTVFLEMIRDFRKGTLEKFRVTPFREFFVHYSDGKTSYVRPHKHASPNHALEVVLDDDFDNVISVTNEPSVQVVLKPELSDGCVYFIGVDRVAAKQKKQRNNSKAQTISRVEDCSEQLKEYIRNALANYAHVSQKLDQSFPQRLVSADAFSGSVTELKSMFASIARQRQRYQSIGVLGEIEASSPFDTSELEKLDASRYATLALYAEDAKNKLSALESLVNRLEIFLGTLNSRFQNKAVSVSIDSGLQLHDTHAKLNLSTLSSGEQHLLIILYDLLFSTSAGTLVLIDEPELSWHISWQRQFIDDLLAIIELSDVDVMLATHSPDIVGDRSDLMVSLSAKPSKLYKDAA